MLPGHYIRDCPSRFTPGAAGAAAAATDEARLRAVVLNVLASVTAPVRAHQQQQFSGQSGVAHEPPPPGYVCNRCHVAGHLITNCPTRGPPPGYVCHRCNQPGHLVQDCPTKGDPRFDNSRNDLQQQQGLHLAATWPPQHHLAMWSQAQQLHQPQDYQSQHYLLQQQQQQQQQPSLYYPQL